MRKPLLAIALLIAVLAAALLTVAPLAAAPAFTAQTPPPAVVGQPYGYRFATDTGGSIRLYAGQLPSGCALDVLGGGQLTCTATTTGVWAFTLSAAHSSGSTLSQLITMQVVAPPTATRTATPTASPTPAPTPSPTVAPTAIASSVVFTAGTPPTTAVVGQSYVYTFVASGTPAPTYSVTSGALPPGFFLDANNGVLVGVPTQAGVYPFVVAAKNSAGQALTSVTVTVASGAVCVAPTLEAAVLPATLPLDFAFSYQFTATGTQPSFRLAGGGIPGLTVSAAGLLSGTPYLWGNYSVQITVTNACGTDTRVFFITVPQAPSAQPTSDCGRVSFQSYPAEFQMYQGQPFAYTFRTTGGTGAVRIFALDGIIASGLTLKDNADGTATLAGTVGQFPPGSTFTMGAQDAAGNLCGSAVWEHVLVPGAPLFLDAVAGRCTLPNGLVGQPYTYTFRMSGTPPLTFSLVGGLFPIALPGQSLLNPQAGTLSGVPMITGNYQLLVQAQNALGATVVICTASVR